MAGKKSLKEQIEEQKRKASIEAETTLQEYQGKANDFHISIDRVLVRINETTQEVRKQNSDVLSAFEDERLKRKALEDNKTQAISEKTVQFKESMRQTAQDLEAWIDDMKSSSKEHHERLTEKNQQYAAKLDDLKKNTPEEHLRKAEEHKATFEARKEVEERSVRRVEEKLGEVRIKIENERRGATNQMDQWCQERMRQLEATKKDTLSKIEMRFQEIHNELTKAAFDLGVVEK